MRPKKEGTDEEKLAEEKECAKIARDALKELIMYKMITFEGKVDYDKYGRILGYPVCEGVNIKEWLIEKRFGVGYEGATKTKVDWKKYFAGEENFVIEEEE